VRKTALKKISLAVQIFPSTGRLLPTPGTIRYWICLIIYYFTKLENIAHQPEAPPKRTSALGNVHRCIASAHPYPPLNLALPTCGIYSRTYDNFINIWTWWFKYRYLRVERTHYPDKQNNDSCHQNARCSKMWKSCTYVMYFFDKTRFAWIKAKAFLGLVFTNFSQLI